MSEEKRVIIDETTTEEKESGVASTVFRACLVGDSERWIAIKSSPTKRKFSPEPHDLIKEIDLLSRLSHVNIVEVVGSTQSGATIELYTPWITHSLETLLDLPTFTPIPIPSQIRHLIRGSALIQEDPSREAIFGVVAKSIVYQMIRALEYLHSLKDPVGHRDIKPRNILMDTTGCVKLIDFGIAYQESTNSASTNLWPESKDNMYSDVATGPFRAPELLFGPKTYDSCATDLWSLGCTIAHFFTPIQLHRKSYYEEDEGEDDDMSDDDKWSHAYVLPKDVDSITFRSAEWIRWSLFDSRRGGIGLVWSIFKLLGTPNEENWPNFDSLPDANKMEFKIVPAQDIRSLLPNLPPNASSKPAFDKPTEDPSATPLDLIRRLLVYPPEKRLKASEAIRHPWFASFEGNDVPLVRPPGSNGYEECSALTEWKEKGLGHWLNIALGGR